MRKSQRAYKSAVKKLKRCNDKIVNDRILSSAFSGKNNFFDEIKRLRGKPTLASSRIDEKVGHSNISEHFDQIYSKLYSSIDYGEGLQCIHEKINNSINHDSSVFCYLIIYSGQIQYSS